MPVRYLRIAIACSVLSSSLSARAADQQWNRISSDHFIVLTDAKVKAGQEIAARFEQMRAVFGELLGRRKLRASQPIDIIAIANDQEYRQLADSQSANAAGFVLSGDDRVYFVLNLSQPDSWRSAEHQLAHYFLKYNYPPTQPWFDEGLAEYFASLNFTAKKTELGADPELGPASLNRLFGSQTQPNGMKSLTELLSAPVWLSLPDLFGMKNRVVNGQEGTHFTLFYAQAWITMHYLINKDRLAETGKYMQLTMSQKLPVEQAIQQAYGMSATQLDQEIKDYFHSLKPLFSALEEYRQPNPPPTPDPVYESPLPFTVDEVGTSSREVSLPAATALVNEMELRIPERRDLAIQELEKLVADEKTETAIAHRALGWAYLQKDNLNHAYTESRAAIQINANDPWVRYYLALTTYRSGEEAARVQGLANMMESLQIVLNEYPEFAEAYNMMGWARLVGGGANSAVEAMQMAVQLSPRNEEYQLRLSRAYLAAKKYDAATSILNQLEHSPNPAIARMAKKDLVDLPFLKKYGVSPAQESVSLPAKSAKTAANNGEGNLDHEEETPGKPQVPETPKIDRRPVHFLKGKVISVECSGAAAVVTFSGEGRTLKLRTAHRDSALVIGAPNFSCDWKNIRANVNYRAGAGQQGDLISIEIL